MRRPAQVIHFENSYLSLEAHSGCGSMTSFECEKFHSYLVSRSKREKMMLLEVLPCPFMETMKKTITNFEPFHL